MRYGGGHHGDGISGFSYRGDDVGGISCCLLLLILMVFSCSVLQLMAMERGPKRKPLQIEHRDR